MSLSKKLELALYSTAQHRGRIDVEERLGNYLRFVPPDTHPIVGRTKRMRLF